MARNSVGPWDGGFIREDSSGRRYYWIRRMVGGRRFEVNTRATTTRGAIEQLKIFETDPAGYSPGGGQSGERLELTAPLVSEFLTWSSSVQKNSQKWVAEQRLYLAWWAEQLGDRDLRRMDLGRDLIPVLEGVPARGHKIAVLKKFLGWLVTEKRDLTPDQDPTFRALLIPQARPEQWLRVKAFDQAKFRATRERLDGHWRDAIDVLAGTGWHVSELVRFVRGGDVEAHPAGTGRVLSCPQTKGGEPLRTAVSAAVAEAGERLRTRGTLDPFRLADAVKLASADRDKNGKLKRNEDGDLTGYITPGKFRHAVATWAVNAGADPASVAAFLNHKSPRTTRKFYATHAVAKKIPTLL